MRQTIRLFWRTARFEILAGILLSVVLTAGLLIVAARLDAIRAADCPGRVECDSATWLDLEASWAQPLLFAMGLLPFAVGILFGPLIVGRELERRTAPLAWSLSADRAAWLLWRLVPPTFLVLLLLVGPAMAANRLEAAHLPTLDPGASFADFGLRGPPVVARGLAVFGVGVVTGVLFGRILPAIVATLAVCLVGLIVLGALRPIWLPREEIPREVMDGGTREDPLAFGEGYRLPDGRLLTFSESTPLRPTEARVLDTPAYAAWLKSSGWTRVAIGIRGFRVGQIEAREAAASGTAALGALGLALMLVRRRRPVPGIAPEMDAIGARPSDDGPPVERPAWRRRGPWLSWLMTTGVGRFELIGASLAAVAVVAAVLVVLQLLADARVAQGCVGTDCIGTGPFSRINNPLDDWLYPPLAALPFIVGGLLGAPVLAREFEAHTAPFTFSLTAGRLRWFVWRALPPLALTVVLLAPAAIVGAWLLHDRWLVDPSYFIANDAIRGPGLVARGIATFGLAVLAGVATRRVLPALIVVAFGSILVYNALDWALPRWVEAVPVEMGAEVPGSWSVTMVARAPDGSLHDPRQLAISLGFTGPGPEGRPEFRDWLDANDYEMMVLEVPAGRYPEIVLRQSATLILGGLVAMGAAALVLERRRPG